MKNTRLGLIGMLLLLVGLTAVFSQPAAAAPTVDFVVNALDDTSDSTCDAAHCSLREALIIANGNPDENTITFAVSGIIVLEDTLTVGHDLVIDGTGQAIIISGADRVRVLTLVAGETVPILELKALTIAGGSSDVGAGIYNNGGDLIISGSVITGNAVSNSGGGIYSTPDSFTTISASRFEANEADFNGGAIFIEGGVLVVEGTTISGNNAPTGGGIATFGATTTINNSTFFDNESLPPHRGPAFAHQGGATTITNSTIAGNSPGGLVNFGGSFTVANTIIADNDGDNCAGTISNGGNNIDSGASCGWDAADGSMSSTDPRLGPLSLFGGLTPVFSLLPDSPAIDGVVFNAPNGCPATDQRGVARPRGDFCDIGAFEVEPPPPPPPPAGNMVFLPVVLGE